MNDLTVQLLVANRTFDAGILLGIVNDEELFGRISEDGVDSYLPSIYDEFWVLLSAGSDVIGCYRIHKVSGIQYQIHAFLLLEKRKQYSKESGRLILQWCIDNIEDMNKLVAEIPAKYADVLKFTKGMGFQDEGINRQSFLKDGEIWDQYRLGQTKTEIKEWLAQ